MSVFPTAVLVIVLIGCCLSEVVDYSLIREFDTSQYVATSYASYQVWSMAQCLSKCLKEAPQGKCRAAGYNQTARTCLLSSDTRQELISIDSPDNSAGVFVMFKDSGCVEEGYLVNGPHPLPDAQITESSVYNEMHAASGGRLFRQYSATHVGAWCPYYHDNQWIQIRFNSRSTISAVALQGRPLSPMACCNHYIKTFRFMVSDDCVNFTFLKNAAGSDIIFNGTTHHDLLVVVPLPEARATLCVRMCPRTYNTVSCARIDVIGCSQSTLFP